MTTAKEPSASGKSVQQQEQVRLGSRCVCLRGGERGWWRVLRLLNDCVFARL